MNKQITILVNKISRLKNYVNNHKLHIIKVSQLFGKFESAIYCFERSINKNVKHPDNYILEQKEWSGHIGMTNEVKGLINMDAYDREQVYGKNYEDNITKLNELYTHGIKYYIIKNNKLQALPQDSLAKFINNFTIKDYFPSIITA